MKKILDKGFIDLVDSMGNDDTVITTARISYYKQNEKIEDKDNFIKRLIKNGHTSPFEQVEFQFLVKCPIFVARQWMRHRTWSYNELSRRYSDASMSFYYPESLRSKSLSEEEEKYYTKEIEVCSKQMKSLYDIMCANNVPKELSRIILPVNLYTVFYAKTDLHNLFHFLELRGSSYAQKEIQVYAHAIEKLIEPIVPLSYKYWKEIKGN